MDRIHGTCDAWNIRTVEGSHVMAHIPNAAVGSAVGFGIQTRSSGLQSRMWTKAAANVLEGTLCWGNTYNGNNLSYVVSFPRNFPFLHRPHFPYFFLFHLLFLSSPYIFPFFPPSPFSLPPLFSSFFPPLSLPGVLSECTREHSLTVRLWVHSVPVSPVLQRFNQHILHTAPFLRLASLLPTSP